MAPAAAAGPPTPAAVSALGQQYPGSCIWSLELLIAAALCATRDANNPFPGAEVAAAAAPSAACHPHRGMELLSELAELDMQQQRRSSAQENGGGRWRKRRRRRRAEYTQVLAEFGLARFHTNYPTGERFLCGSVQRDTETSHTGDTRELS